MAWSQKLSMPVTETWANFLNVWFLHLHSSSTSVSEKLLIMTPVSQEAKQETSQGWSNERWIIICLCVFNKIPTFIQVPFRKSEFLSQVRSLQMQASCAKNKVTNAISQSAPLILTRWAGEILYQLALHTMENMTGCQACRTSLRQPAQLKETADPSVDLPATENNATYLYSGLICPSRALAHKLDEKQRCK